MKFRLMIGAIGMVFCLGSIAPADVTMTPGDAYSTTLQPSGWSVAEKVYTLTNTSSDWIYWQASSVNGKAECAPSAGWIGPGLSVGVAVRPIDTMASAQAGTYTDQITLDFVERIAGDIDGNGQVNVFDIMVLADSWNTTGEDANFDAKCDLDSDGAVNIFDVFIVAENWNRQVGA